MYNPLKSLKKAIFTGLITVGGTITTFVINYVLKNFGIDGDMNIGEALNTILSNVGIVGSSATVASIFKYILDFIKHRDKKEIKNG